MIFPLCITNALLGGYVDQIVATVLGAVVIVEPYFLSYEKQLYFIPVDSNN